MTIISDAPKFWQPKNESLVSAKIIDRTSQMTHFACHCLFCANNVGKLQQVNMSGGVWTHFTMTKNVAIGKF